MHINLNIFIASKYLMIYFKKFEKFYMIYVFKYVYDFLNVFIKRGMQDHAYRKFVRLLDMYNYSWVFSLNYVNNKQNRSFWHLSKIHGKYFLHEVFNIYTEKLRLSYNFLRLYKLLLIDFIVASFTEFRKNVRLNYWRGKMRLVNRLNLRSQRRMNLISMWLFFWSSYCIQYIGLDKIYINISFEKYKFMLFFSEFVERSYVPLARKNQLLYCNANRMVKINMQDFFHRFFFHYFYDIFCDNYGHIIRCI
jgi:hypothetical protein